MQYPITKLWPLISCYYYGLRNNIISMRSRTFYKYAHILGFSKPKVQHRRKKHTIGIRAYEPNQLWHADLTIFRTLDNIKVYIYIIMDHYSRKILSYKASLKYSAELSLQCLKEAYQNFIQPLSEKPDVQGRTSVAMSGWQGATDVKLMVDGGTEINNDKVDQYLTLPDISVQKIIALQDISFSNSMIEAVNKILKYNYLFKTDIPDFNSCVKYLDSYIPNYNNRYHCSLSGLTPDEAYSGISINKEIIDNRIITAKKLRISAQLCPNLSCKGLGTFLLPGLFYYTFFKKISL